MSAQKASIFVDSELTVDNITIKSLNDNYILGASELGKDKYKENEVDIHIDVYYHYIAINLDTNLFCGSLGIYYMLGGTKIYLRKYRDVSRLSTGINIAKEELIATTTVEIDGSPLVSITNLNYISKEDKPAEIDSIILPLDYSDCDSEDKTKSVESDVTADECITNSNADYGILTQEEIEALLEVTEDTSTTKQVADILSERGNEYKVPFETNAKALGKIIKVMAEYPNVTDEALGAAVYMQIKILRFLGNPNHEDTKLDLVGYSTLIKENL